jgi:hypothetical protein
MRTPQLFWTHQIRNTNMWTETKRRGWVPARPLGFQGIALRTRLRLAWAVFTGKYDVLRWESEHESQEQSALAKADCDGKAVTEA